MSTTKQGSKTHAYPQTTYTQDTFKGCVRVLEAEAKPITVLVLESGHRAFFSGGVE